MWTVRLTSLLGTEKDIECDDKELVELVQKGKVKGDTLLSHPVYTKGQWFNAKNVPGWERITNLARNLAQESKEEVRLAKVSAANERAKAKRRRREANEFAKRAKAELSRTHTPSQDEPPSSYSTVAETNDATIQTTQTYVPNSVGVATQLVVTHHSNHLGVAGFVTSILGFFTCGVLAPIGLVLSIFGLLYTPRGMAIAGVAISCVSFIPAALFVLPIILGVGSMAAVAPINARQTEVAKRELKNFRVEVIAFESDVNIINRVENNLTIEVTNGLQEPISRFYGLLICTTPGRSIPHIKDTFNYEFNGGIEPGENKELSLSPNMLTDLGSTQVPDTAQTEIIVYRVDGADGEALYDIEDEIREEYSVRYF